MNGTGELQPGEFGRVLASGIDSLRLAINLRWPDTRTFEHLARLKAQAKGRADDEPVTVMIGDGESTARFTVKPHGKDGFEWLLSSREMSIALGNWQEPKQRPSAMVDLRSETLWTLGAEAAVERVAEVLRAMGSRVQGIKPSRVDLCLDILLPAASWRTDLAEHFVLRARATSTHHSKRELSGFSFGKGAVMARIYDKPREIKEKSNKVWMHTIWAMPQVPDDHRIIRVEFQVRRDALREAKLHEWAEARSLLPRFWAYCSQRWIRLVDDPGQHHTQQRITPWWQLVQVGSEGAQGATLVVRSIAANADQKRLAAQSIGTLSSIAAIKLSHSDAPPDAPVDVASILKKALNDAVATSPINEAEFSRRIAKKRAKYGRPLRVAGERVARTEGPPVESAPTEPEGTA